MMIKMIGLAVWMTTLSVCDVRKKSVPLWLLWVGAGMAAAVILHEIIEGQLQIISMIKAILPGAALLFLAAGTGKAGCADGLILIVLGIVEGHPGSLIVCMISLTLTAAVSGILLMAKRVKRSTKIPFVPFLEAGWIIGSFGKWGGT